MPFCPKCGKPFEEGHTFCGSCGSKLPEVPRAEGAKRAEEVPDASFPSVGPGADGTVPPTTETLQPTLAPMRTTPMKPLVIVALVAVVAVVGIVGVLLSRRGGEAVEPETKPAVTDVDPEAKPAVEDVLVIQDTFDEEAYYANVDDEHYATDEDSGARFVDNELLAYAVEGASPDEVAAAIKSVGGEVVGRLGDIGLYQVRFAETMAYADELQLCEELIATDTIYEAYPHFVNDLEDDASVTNDDIWTGAFTDGLDYRWAYDAIELPDAWDMLVKEGVIPGEGVTVGIVEGEYFYTDHVDLQGHITEYIDEQKVGTRDFSAGDTDVHATHVAGTIGAQKDNGYSVGIAYGSELLGFAKSASSPEIAFMYALETTCKESDSGHTILNISMGENHRNPLSGFVHDLNRSRRSDFIATGMHRLRKNYDFIVCKSAGNDNATEAGGFDASRDYVNQLLGDYTLPEEYETSVTEYGTYMLTHHPRDPIAFDEFIIVVGNHDSTDTMYTESNGGACVQIAAPGTEICSSGPSSDGTQSSLFVATGTSQATPMVTGVAALVWSANPNLTAAKVKQIIIDSATYQWDEKTSELSEKPLCSYSAQDQGRITAFDATVGYPKLDAAEAVKAALNWDQYQKDLEKHRESAMVDEAEAAGRQVFTGTVHVAEGEDAMNYATTPGYFYGNGDYAAQRYLKSTFAFLVFDTPQTVRNISKADSSLEGSYASVLIGQALPDREDTASKWRAYDGQRVCMATDDFSQSAGADFPGGPKAGYAEVLYTADEADSTQDAVDPAASDVSSEWVLPESDMRVYSYDEVSKLSDDDLVIARNEIYARHGRGFRDAELQAYFNSKSWYERRYEPEEFDAMPSPLTDAEDANVALIQRVEGER